MSAMASQNTDVSIAYSIVCSGANERKDQSSSLLTFVRGIHRWPVNSPHKAPVMRKRFSFDGVIMNISVFLEEPFMLICYHWKHTRNFCEIFHREQEQGRGKARLYWKRWIDFHSALDVLTPRGEEGGRVERMGDCKAPKLTCCSKHHIIEAVRRQRRFALFTSPVEISLTRVVYATDKYLLPLKIVVCDYSSMPWHQRREFKMSSHRKLWM